MRWALLQAWVGYLMDTEEQDCIAIGKKVGSCNALLCASTALWWVRAMPGAMPRVPPATEQVQPLLVIDKLAVQLPWRDALSQPLCHALPAAMPSLDSCPPNLPLQCCSALSARGFELPVQPKKTAEKAGGKGLFGKQGSGRKGTKEVRGGGVNGRQETLLVVVLLLLLLLQAWARCCKHLSSCFPPLPPCPHHTALPQTGRGAGRQRPAACG